jgi:hypothetical protein
MISGAKHHKNDEKRFIWKLRSQQSALANPFAQKIVTDSEMSDLAAIPPWRSSPAPGW